MSHFLHKPYQKTPTTIRLQNETLAAIDRKSYLLNMSRNKFICQCIDFAMQHGDFPLHRVIRTLPIQNGACLLLRYTANRALQFPLQSPVYHG